MIKISPIKVGGIYKELRLSVSFTEREDNKKIIGVNMKNLNANLVFLSVCMGLAFGFLMGIFFGMSTTPFSHGFNLGLGSGLFFGIGMYVFMKGVTKKLSVIPEELRNEEVLAYGGANHFKGAEGRGGCLYITKKGLHWKGNGKNFNNEDLFIKASDIASFGPRMTMGFIPTGLFVQLKSGHQEKFVVSRRDEWLQTLHESTGLLISATPQNLASHHENRTSSTVSKADEIKKLNDLKSEGVLTEDEFQKEKEKLLAG